MSSTKLINQLETLGKLDARIIAKLREQVKSSAEPPKATSILKFLVKKGLLSESEAKELYKNLKSAAAGEPPALQSHEVADAEEAAEIAMVEESLSEVIDPGDLLVAMPVAVPMETASMSVPDASYDLMSDANSQSVAPPNGNRGEGQGESQAYRKWDTQNQWASKWPFIGFGVLVFLAMIGAFLAIWLGGVSADKQYDAAINSMKNLTYADAEEKFAAYIEDNPSHKFADTARALRVQAAMRNKFSAKRWKETIQTARNELPELSQQENTQLSKIRDDVGLMLSESLFHETEAAVDLETLPEMEASVVKLDDDYSFIDNPNYLSGTARKGQRVATFLADIENNIQTVNGLINKEKDYGTTLTTIKGLGQESKTDDAFETYIRLTREYPDLAARRELRDQMKEISKAEQDLVLPLDQKTVVESGAPSSAVQSSVVLASTVGETINGLRDEVIPALVDGAVYGFDAGTGEVKWRHFVGLQTTYEPLRYDVDTVVVSDLLRNEVSQIKLDTGEVLWRALIDEAFHEPTFHEQRILITTNSGRLIFLDGANGEMAGGAKIPQAANSGGLIASRAPVLYQPGSYSNLYAISTTDFQCKEVLYLGHYRNSISVPPVTWSGYIILVRNGGDFADLLVLKPDETGLNLKVNQIINRVTESQVNTPMAYFGRGLILYGDGGDVRILELNPGDEVSPVTVLAKTKHDTQNQTTFFAHKGSNVWAAGKGIRRYKVQRSLGQFKSDDNSEPGDSFLGNPTVLDDKLFHVRRRANSHMASASLVDGKTLKPIWQTNFSGPVAGVAGGRKGLTAISNQGDVFGISQNEMQAGVAQKAIIASEVIESLKFNQLVSVGDDEFVAANGKGAKDLLYYRLGDPQSRLFNMAIDVNDQPQQPPIAMGGNLIVASRQGLISKLNPKSGQIVGAPFLPPVSPGLKIPWHPLVPLTDSVFAAAHAAVTGEGSVTSSKLYFLSVESEDSVSKVAELEFSQSIVSKIVADGRNVYGVQGGVQGGDQNSDNDSLFKVEAGAQPSVSAEQKLAHRYVDGPWMVGDAILLQLDDDSLTCFDKEFSERWTLPIGNVQIASISELKGDAMVVFTNGRLVKVNTQQGTITKQLELVQPVVGSPVFAGANVIFSGADGTIHMIQSSQLE